MGRGLLLVSAIAWFACGGGGGGGGSDGITVRDSAGVEIVEHPAGFEEALPSWVVDSVPLVDLGGREEPGHDLHQIGGAASLGGGRIVVANRGSSELRYFDSSGKYLFAAGRPGEGPGEFRYLGAMQLLAGDTLFVLDYQVRRGSLFSPAGEFLRSFQFVRSEEGTSVSEFALLRTGHRLAEHQRLTGMSETSGPTRRDSFALVVLDLGTIGMDTIVVVPGSEVYPVAVRVGGSEFPALHGVEFGRSSAIGTDGVRVLVGTNESNEVRIYRERGELARIIRSATPAEPVTEEHRNQRRRENEARMAQQRTSEQVSDANPRSAATFPYYERILPGGEGTLWIELPRRYNDEGRRFVVFDSTGRAIARVQCPERMRPYEVGPDRIIGLWRDPDDVQHVRVYRVERSS